MGRPVRILIAAAGVAASAVAIDRLYRRFLREWMLTWGRRPRKRRGLYRGTTCPTAPTLLRPERSGSTLFHQRSGHGWSAARAAPAPPYRHDGLWTRSSRIRASSP